MERIRCYLWLISGLLYPGQHGNFASIIGKMPQLRLCCGVNRCNSNGVFLVGAWAILPTRMGYKLNTYWSHGRSPKHHVYQKV